MSLNPLEPWSIEKNVIVRLCAAMKADEIQKIPTQSQFLLRSSRITHLSQSIRLNSQKSWLPPFWTSHGSMASTVPATSVQPANLGHQFQDDFRCSSTKPIHALITQAIIQQMTLARIIPKGFAMDKSCGKPKKRCLGKIGNGYIIAWFIVGYTPIWDGFSLNLPH